MSGPSLINENTGYSDEFLLGLLNSTVVDLAMSVLSPTMHMNQTALSKISFDKIENVSQLSNVEETVLYCINIRKKIGILLKIHGISNGTHYFP